MRFSKLYKMLIAQGRAEKSRVFSPQCFLSHRQVSTIGILTKKYTKAPHVFWQKNLEVI